MKLRRLPYIIVLLQLLLPLPLSSLPAQHGDITISSVEEIKSEFNSVPCKDTDRLNAAKALFAKMGAADADMSVEKFKNVENLVVRKQGTSQEILVIGAHYDKVADGCGAIDNWTGVVTLAYLYKSLRNVPLEKTILFVAFGKEEKGLVGSRAMVSAISKEQLPQYCAMINIDSLGLAVPQAADNMSSKKLELFVADTAKIMKIGFNHATIQGADADSSAFIEKKIPAVTIHGLNNDWPTILHSRNDQPAKVNAASVYLGYRLVLGMVYRLDETPCGTYR
jgi:Iap family predicted aminopeptidase